MTFGKSQKTPPISTRSADIVNPPQPVIQTWKVYHRITVTGNPWIRIQRVYKPRSWYSMSSTLNTIIPTAHQPHHPLPKSRISSRLPRLWPNRPWRWRIWARWPRPCRFTHSMGMSKIIPCVKCWKNWMPKSLLNTLKYTNPLAHMVEVCGRNHLNPTWKKTCLAPAKSNNLQLRSVFRAP